MSGGYEIIVFIPVVAVVFFVLAVWTATAYIIGSHRRPEPREPEIRGPGID
jgi:hypothetical protein